MSSTTRRTTLGTKTTLDIGRPNRSRFSPEAKALICSVEAIELQHYLGRPPQFLTRVLKATRRFKFEKSEAYVLARRSIDQDKSLSPSRREDLKQGLRTAALSAQLHDRRLATGEAVSWVKLVRRYNANRDWITSKAEPVRFAIVKWFERELHQTKRNFVPSSSKEEERRRDTERNSLRKHDKRMRKQFGWRAVSDGRVPHLSLDADRNVDPVEQAKAEFASLFASQSAKNNKGVSVFSPWDGLFDGDEGRTMAQRLAREVKLFRQRQSDNDK